MPVAPFRLSRRLLAVPEQHHLAGLQHIAAIGDGKRHGGVLLDHEDGGALLVDGLDDLEHLIDEGRRQAHRRLVHADQARPRHQGPPDGHHLLLAARERAGELLAPLLDAREQAVHPLQIIVQILAIAARVGAHLEVLEHGHAREQPPRLGHRCNAEPDARRPSAAY